MASPSLAVALLGMTLILAAASAAEGGFPKAASAREKVALEEEAKTASAREKAAHSSTAACRAWFALPPAERPKKKECDWESWSNPTSGGASQGAHEYGPHTSKEHAEYGPQKQVPVGVGSKWPLKSEREESWADPKSGPGARHFDAAPPLVAATPATPTSSSHAAAGTTTGKLPKEELKVRTDLTIADIAAVDAVKHDAATGQPDKQPRFAPLPSSTFTHVSKDALHALRKENMNLVVLKAEAEAREEDALRKVAAGVHRSGCFDACPQPITSACYLKCYPARFVEVHRASHGWVHGRGGASVGELRTVPVKPTQAKGYEPALLAVHPAAEPATRPTLPAKASDVGLVGPCNTTGPVDEDAARVNAHWSKGAKRTFALRQEKPKKAKGGEGVVRGRKGLEYIAGQTGAEGPEPVLVKKLTHMNAAGGGKGYATATLTTSGTSVNETIENAEKMDALPSDPELILFPGCSHKPCGPVSFAKAFSLSLASNQSKMNGNATTEICDGITPCKEVQVASFLETAKADGSATRSVTRSESGSEAKGGSKSGSESESESESESGSESKKRFGPLGINADGSCKTTGISAIHVKRCCVTILGLTTRLDGSTLTERHAAHAAEIRALCEQCVDEKKKRAFKNEASAWVCADETDSARVGYNTLLEAVVPPRFRATQKATAGSEAEAEAKGKAGSESESEAEVGSKWGVAASSRSVVTPFDVEDAADRAGGLFRKSLCPGTEVGMVMQGKGSIVDKRCCARKAFAPATQTACERCVEKRIAFTSDGVGTTGWICGGAGGLVMDTHADTLLPSASTLNALAVKGAAALQDGVLVHHLSLALKGSGSESEKGSVPVAQTPAAGSEGGITDACIACGAGKANQRSGQTAVSACANCTQAVKGAAALRDGVLVHHLSLALKGSGSESEKGSAAAGSEGNTDASGGESESTAAGKAESKEGKATEGKAPEGKATEGKAVEGKAVEGKAVEGKAVEGKAVEGKFIELVSSAPSALSTLLQMAALPHFKESMGATREAPALLPSMPPTEPARNQAQIEALSFQTLRNIGLVAGPHSPSRSPATPCAVEPNMVATGALSSKSCDCYHGTPHPSCGCPLPGSKGCDCDCPTGTPPVTCGCGTPRSVILLASAKKDAATGNGLRGYT